MLAGRDIVSRSLAFRFAPDGKICAQILQNAGIRLQIRFFAGNNKFLPADSDIPFFDCLELFFCVQKNFPATENYNCSKIREIIEKVHRLFSRQREEY